MRGEDTFPQPSCANELQSPARRAPSCVPSVIRKKRMRVSGLKRAVQGEPLEGGWSELAALRGEASRGGVGQPWDGHRVLCAAPHPRPAVPVVKPHPAFQWDLSTGQRDSPHEGQVSESHHIRTWVDLGKETYAQLPRKLCRPFSLRC